MKPESHSLTLFFLTATHLCRRRLGLRGRRAAITFNLLDSLSDGYLDCYLGHKGKANICGSVGCLCDGGRGTSVGLDRDKSGPEMTSVNLKIKIATRLQQN